MAEILIIARALHIAGVVVWIGGVFFVTFVLLPALQQFAPKERLVLFERLEHRFAWFARIAVIVVGISGLVLANGIAFWARWQETHLWPVHLMVVVWMLFALMLFVLEPFILHRVFHRLANEAPERALNVAKYVHWLLSALSFTAVMAGVMLVHGWDF